MLEVYVQVTPPPRSYSARFARENFSRADFENLIDGAGLFGERIIVRGENLLADDSAAIELLPRLVGSPNLFCLIEDELSAAVAKEVRAAGGKLSQKPIVKARPSFNVFALSDTFAARERKKLWVIYQRALHLGLPAEEIFWKFQWAVKNLLLAKAGEENLKGLNPFVAGRMRAAAKNFTRAELQNLSRQLITLFHGARRGERDLEIGLEKLILGL